MLLRKSPAGFTWSALLAFLLLPCATSAQPTIGGPGDDRPIAAGTTDAAGTPTAGVSERPADDPQGRGGGARGAPPHPIHVAPVRPVGGRVFIGGYFYDPFFGPYPWWRWPDYPYWYYPVYDARAELHIRVTPDAGKLAAVYVDGFYAGIVDDFDGTFQSLHLPPGGHVIVLYLEGYRTVRHNLYLRPGSGFTLHEVLVPLLDGERSEPPVLAPAVPPPPAGSYSQPPVSSPIPPPAITAAARQAEGYGTLDMFVQPVDAEVRIDGQTWVTSEEGHFVVQVSVGMHRVEVIRPGHHAFARDLEVREGQETPLNVSLARQ